MRNSPTVELAGARSGRRSGPSATRAAVLSAAQRQFAELGYDRTTMRSIAAEAGVDQKLVGYFFSSKQALFVAATKLPFDAGKAIPHVLGGDARQRGWRLAQLVLEMLENPETGPRLVGLVRAAASEPEAARMARDLFAGEIWAPAAEALPVTDPALAVSQIATQILGLVMSRYIIRTEPLASLQAEAVVDLMAPVLQRLLGGKQGDER